MSEDDQNKSLFERVTAPHLHDIRKHDLVNARLPNERATEESLLLERFNAMTRVEFLQMISDALDDVLSEMATAVVETRTEITGPSLADLLATVEVKPVDPARPGLRAILPPETPKADQPTEDDDKFEVPKFLQRAHAAPEEPEVVEEPIPAPSRRRIM